MILFGGFLEIHAFPIHLDSNVWYVKEGFSSSYTNIEKQNLKDFHRKEATPVLPEDFSIISDHSSQIEMTIITYFIFSEYSSNKPLGFFLPTIGENWQVYINGKLLAEEMHLSEKKEIKTSRYVFGKMISFDSSLLRSGENILCIRILGNPDIPFTGLSAKSGYEISTLEVLQKEKSDEVILVLSFLYLVIGLYHLLLYTKRRKDLQYLFFGLFSFLISLYIIFRSNRIYSYPIDSYLLTKWEYCLAYTLAPLQIAFLESLFYKKISSTIKGYFLFCGLLFLITMFVPMEYTIYFLRSWQISILLFAFYCGYLLVNAIKRKVSTAKTISIGFVFLAIASFMDILDSIFFKTRIQFLQTGFFIYILGIATLLANRFMEVHNQAEELNIHLDEKVKERTRELAETLNSVSELKIKQDFDYYLATRLIEPLTQNNHDSRTVQVDYTLKQKKQFIYKGKQYELGGDFCTSDRVNICGKFYTIFVNGDAMGKSIQGASGALVLGVVFKSLISRTKLFKENSDKPPEIWLKDCFVELQEIFKSFDGRMLVSSLLGVLDEANGFLYYINTDHPWLVLYRNSKSSFLDEEHHFYKLGMLGVKQEIVIRTFQMQKGDVLISGSDGKDDFLFFDPELEMVRMNFDTNNFLERVEVSRGDLNQIMKLTEQVGEVTDDISLLRVEFNGTNESFRSREKSILTAKQNTRNGKLIEAIEIYKQLSSEFPRSNSLLYRVSSLCKQVGLYKEAIEYGMRLKLRLPNHLQNLINLSESFSLVGDLKNTQDILDKLKTLSVDKNKLD